MDLTFFDFAIIGIIAFFALIGLMRGFVREVFSIFNWVIAGIATIYLRPFVTNLILMKIDIPVVANLISNSFLFTTTLILVSVVTSNIARGFNNKIPTSINISLGFAFGMLKGYILSALIFALVLYIYGGQEAKPEWITNSKTHKPLSLGAFIIEPFTESLFGNISGGKEGDDDIRDLIQDLQESKENLDQIKDSTDTGETPDTTEDTTEEKKGYGKDQIKKMDRLIDTITD